MDHSFMEARKSGRKPLRGERLGYAANVTYICNVSLGDFLGMGRLLRVISVPFHSNDGPGFAQGPATKWARDQTINL
jgi:hypothetical protein